MAKADIVVGIDGSRDAERALRWAVHAARPRDACVRAILVWAAAGPPCEQSHPPPATSPEHPRWTAQWMLNDVVERVTKDEPSARIHPRTLYGPPVQKLLAEADDAALLVLGVHGTSRTHRILTGSVSLACAHGATVPVVVVRGEPHGDGHAPIVVGVDGSQASVDALVWAADEAALRRAPLRVAHVWEPVPTFLAAQISRGDEAAREAARAVLEQSVSAGLAGRPGLQVDTSLIEGTPAHSLINAAAHAQLLVVGGRGCGGFAQLLLGSTSSQCLLHAACSVAVVR
ncbi:universal stress protein [Frankia sp. AgB1.9]|uniref:universal stress protein n=1 Tax=unclassified Frankia TaxID=2632575 RepID=UPI001933C5A4|nr:MULTISPECIES: universal stress protein [unclassified Frankia]MBL7488000.1 universal stress protein [Frankia sp. AgW1.1]MBL7549438.1 universal stress protein [Frankia sp. AgB1.9]MBL7619946.1 universal stress protein [Frankia sp. AgB1.8]